MIKNRNYSIDYLRILATFLVIVNHTNTSIFINNPLSKTSVLSISYFFISKIAVGLFFVISGATLLPKNETLKTTYKKRVLPMVFTLILCSFVYYNFLPTKTQTFSLLSFIISIFQNPTHIFLWYLYTYIVLMLALPFLRKISHNLSDKEYIVLILLFIIFGSLIPIIDTVFSFSISHFFNLGFFQMYIGFFFIGDFMFNRVAKKFYSLKGALISLIVFISTIAVSTYITIRDYKILGEYYLKLDNAASFFVTIGIICIVYIAIVINKYYQPSDSIKKFISWISSLTFGIYLTHIFVINRFYFINTKLSQHLNPLISVVIFEVFVFFFCVCIVYIYKLIYRHLKDLLFKRNQKAQN